MNSDDAAAAGIINNVPTDLYSLEPFPQPYTAERESELRNEAIHFHNLYEELNKNFYDYQNFYVVSIKWLNRWKVYTSYNEAIENKPSSKFIGAGQLPILNEEIADTKFEIDIIFEEPYHHLNMAIVDNLKAQVDYILVNKPLWEILDKYQNIELNRKMVKGNDGKKVEVYFKKVTAIILYNDVLKDIEKYSLKQFKKIRLQLPQYESIKDLIPIISEKTRQCLSFNRTMMKRIDISKQDLKVWLVEENMSQSKLKSNFQKGCKANRSFSYKLSFPGIKVDITQTQLSQLEIPSNSIIVFEFKQQKEDWVFFTKQHPLVASKCDYCKTVNLLNVFCPCMYACYCSKQCKNKDKSSHKNRCDREAESSQQEKQQLISQYSKKGRMGLNNLGNTCFMNSGIQCITSIQELTEYFFTKKFIQDINKDNPLGTKGELSIAYEKLIRKMWCGTDNYTSPSVLKRAIGKFQPMFIGYQQHDSGELISYLLDGLHQDLNRVKVKPYVETKNHDGRPDNVLSEQGWNDFLKRNQSKIVQTIFGQYKSRLQCPQCQQQSITFDPFMTFSLPIPQKKQQKMQIILMKNHIESIKTTVIIKKSKDFTIQSVIDQLAEKYQMNNKMVVSGCTCYSCQLVNNTKSASFTRQQYEYKNLLFRQLESFQNSECDEAINVQNSLCHSQYGNENYRRNITYQKIYYFNKLMTLKQIHLRLFSFYKELLKVEDYEKQIINVQPADQRWRILVVSNSRFDACYFCGTTGCENCVLPFSEQITLADMLAKIKPGKDHKFELQIYWRKETQYVEKRFDNIEKQLKGASLSAEQVSIYDCFRIAQQPQQLDQQNEWYCPNCKQFVLAVKQLTLYKAPKVLILYFKRFKGKGERGIFTTKLETNIDFPIQGLDINQFLVDKQLPGVYSEQTNKNVLYDLFAISNHFGGLGGGHYTAFAKKDNQWDQYDDSSVRMANAKSLVSPAAYVLFYKRRQEQIQ